jgi:hypothetical protein
MAELVTIIEQGEEAPTLLVIYYPKGRERHVNLLTDSYLLILPNEGCGNGSLGEMEEMLESARMVVAQHYRKEDTIGN